MINRMGFTGRAALLSSAGLLAFGIAAPAIADTAQPQPKPKPKGQTEAQAQQQQQAQQAAAQKAGNEETIIVTAQRRAQSLFEVPQSISVITGRELEAEQAKTFLDYAQLVPGLNVTQDNPGQSRVILRGINTGSVGSTVAVYVDDIPFGASGSLSNGAVLAGDFDTFDVNRIEVLRGPQGTLYGSNSLGGVLKFITNDPNTSRVEARAQAGFEAVHRGEIGPLFNAMINVPLSDTIAFRASGFYHKVPGQVDAVGRQGKNIDDTASYGGRASLLFRPSEAFSIRLFALAQDIHANSPSSFAADPVTLEPVDPLTVEPSSDRQLRFELIPERHDINYRVYSGTVDYDFGFAALTSITSYSTQKQDQFVDISTNPARDLANLIYAPLDPNTVGLGGRNNASVKKFTEEARLVSPKSNFFDWVVGVYYTHEHTGLDQEFLPFDIATQDLIDPAGTFGPFVFDHFVTAVIDAKYREIAGYANGTFHFGKRFDLNLGGRYSHNKQSSFQDVVQLGNGSPTDGGSSQGVFTWNISPRFEFNDDAAIYARVAKGYRPGGPNFIPPIPPPNFPSEFNADTLVSYEAGLKAQSHDGVFAVDASAFYVNWKDILILTTVDTPAGPAGINANGGRARTYGAEATFSVRPTLGLDLEANLAWTKAYLRDDTTTSTGLNLTGGLAGDRLPFIPRLAATLSADYRWNLTSSAKANIGATIHSQSDQKADFSAAYRAAFGKQVNLNGYTTVELRAGVDLNRFTIQAYVRNLFDSDGLVDAGAFPFTVPVNLGGTGDPIILATSIRPRTFGLVVGAKF